MSESTKTGIAFTVGLLIGAMLIWAFSDCPEPEPKTEEQLVADEQDKQARQCEQLELKIANSYKGDQVRSAMIQLDNLQERGLCPE